MAKTPESKVQLEIMQYLRKQGHLFWRFSPETYNATIGKHVKHEYIPSGLPDIMLIHKEKYGQLWGLEVKRPKGGVKSAGQILMKKRFELNNARYEFVRSVEDVKALGL